MVLRKLYLIPIFFGVWMIATLLITFPTSILTGHVAPILPYISDTGAWVPESCIFGFMLTVAALLLLLMCYLRFRQVSELQEQNKSLLSITKLNKLSFILGNISVFGCLVLAHFRVSEIFFVHIAGAGVCFGFNFLYQVVQVLISFKLWPIIGSKYVNIFRTFMAVLTGFSLCVTMVGLFGSLIEFNGNDMTKWSREDGGYDFHLSSAVSEYMLVTATVIYVVTFVNEFKNVEMHQLQIISVPPLLA